MRILILTLFLSLLASAAVAQDKGALTIGGDGFNAGRTVTQTKDGLDDLFMAGEIVTSAAPISGSAHLAGRRVSITGDVGGDVYAAGMNVSVEGRVAGDATLAGYDVSVGAVGADLRASGSNIAVTGPVGGYALLAGDSVRLDGPVAGDVRLTARAVSFGDSARIDGQLVLYEDAPGTLEVPDRVISADRIERRPAEAWRGETRTLSPFSWGGFLLRYLGALVVVAALAALLAAVLPGQMAAMRRRILDAPLRTLWFGFLTESAVFGSAILFAVTLIGIFLSPASILMAVIGGFVGYLIGSYAFGVGLLRLFGREEPGSTRARMGAAALGSGVVCLIALIPIIGWIIALAVTLAGVGALTSRIFRPRFFVREPTG
ncbi:MAG: hypothetical protein WCD16_08710 [Paracoccaceae bacterium]